MWGAGAFHPIKAMIWSLLHSVWGWQWLLIIFNESSMHDLLTSFYNYPNWTKRINCIWKRVQAMNPIQGWWASPLSAWSMQTNVFGRLEIHFKSCPKPTKVVILLETSRFGAPRVFEQVKKIEKWHNSNGIEFLKLEAGHTLAMKTYLKVYIPTFCFNKLYRHCFYWWSPEDTIFWALGDPS